MILKGADYTNAPKPATSLPHLDSATTRLSSVISEPLLFVFMLQIDFIYLTLQVASLTSIRMAEKYPASPIPSSGASYGCPSPTPSARSPSRSPTGEDSEDHHSTSQEGETGDELEPEDGIINPVMPGGLLASEDGPLSNIHKVTTVLGCLCQLAYTTSAY